MKNNKGFSTIIFLTLIPLLLSIFCFSAGAGLLIVNWQKTLYLCRTELLQAQSYLGKAIEDLTQLNSTAKRLRLEYEYAKKQLIATAGLPPAHAAAQAYMLSVILRQSKLRAQQTMIQKNALQFANQNTQNLKNQLSSSPVFAEQVQTSHPKLAIYPSPPQSLTPDYLEAPLFSINQSITARWQINPWMWLPAWLKNFLPQNDFLQSECSSTLFRKGNSWKANLGKGRYL